MESTANIIGLWEQMTRDGGMPVAAERCVVVRNRHASCRRCAKACPTGAIALKEGALAVDPSRCDRCGACAQACPTEAILAEGTPLPAPLPLRPREAPADVVRVQGDGTLPHFVPERRRQLLDLLEAGGARAREELARQQWGRAEIEVDRCESCRMCAVFCPTGALERFDDEDGTFGLLHTPALCVRCNACTDVCYTGALKLHENFDGEEVALRTTQRIALQPLRYTRGGAHSTAHALRHLLGTEALYER